MDNVDGYDAPIQKEKKKFDLLPDREWINAVISEVKYELDVFNGVTQYITNKNDEYILDMNGNKIPRKIFNITFLLQDFTLDNGNPRKAWLKIGASLGQNAKLPVFLSNLGINLAHDATPRDLELILLNKKVKIQLTNKRSKDGSKTFQNVVYDAVKSA